MAYPLQSASTLQGILLRDRKAERIGTQKPGPTVNVCSLAGVIAFKQNTHRQTVTHRHTHTQAHSHTGTHTHTKNIAVAAAQTFVNWLQMTSNCFKLQNIFACRKLFNSCAVIMHTHMNAHTHTCTYPYHSLVSVACVCNDVKRLIRILHDAAPSRVSCQS